MVKVLYLFKFTQMQTMKMYTLEVSNHGITIVVNMIKFQEKKTVISIKNIDYL